jgi:hypothetical protein
LRPRPEVADDEGGPDFNCANGQFMTEATAFMSGKITSDTALKDEFPEETTGQAYGLLTKQIATKADEKHFQFSQLGRPGILAIASGHVGASLLLNCQAAQYLLTSQPFWLGTNEGMSVDFSLSAFIRLEDDGQIVPYHTGLSAVLLVAITPHHSFVCGALHPAPTHPFKSELMANPVCVPERLADRG